MELFAVARIAAALLLAMAATSCCVCQVATAQKKGARAALHFDGNDCVIVPPNPALDLRGSVTVSAWFRSDGPRSSAEQIMWRGDMQPGLDPYSLVINDGRVAFVLMFNLETAAQAAAPYPVDRDFHFWTGVYDVPNAEVRLYRDAEMVAVTPCARELEYDTAGMWNTIGAVDQGTWQHFNGSIAEIQIWDHARTPEQLRKDMKGVADEAVPGLAGHWNFAEGEGRTLHDRSGHGADGTLGGENDREPVWVKTGM